MVVEGSGGEGGNLVWWGEGWGSCGGGGWVWEEVG